MSAGEDGIINMNQIELISFREDLLKEKNCIKRGLGVHTYKILGMKKVCQAKGCGKITRVNYNSFGKVKYSRNY